MGDKLTGTQENTSKSGLSLEEELHLLAKRTAEYSINVDLEIYWNPQATLTRVKPILEDILVDFYKEAKKLET